MGSMAKEGHGFIRRAAEWPSCVAAAAAAATATNTGARCLLIERSEISSHRNG
jgi:mannose/cellobiose epimerase-like protein (N-acyl-D-glucosamine 2-epimerase family)